MVDWILVEMRSSQLPSSKIESKAGILLSDGRIKSADGTSDLTFNIPSSGNYYFVVRHRNHLDIITSTPITATPNMYYDFTTNATKALGTEQLKTVSDGTAVMFTGDINSAFSIQTTDFDIWILYILQLT